MKDKDMKDDPFRAIKSDLDSVEKEGKQVLGDRIYEVVTEHINLWIDFSQMLEKLSNFDKENSLVVFRWIELQNILAWILMNMIYGRYHTAIRELRYVLDAFIQAYYLDLEHQIADMNCKLEILKEIDKQMFGGRLIDRTNLEHKQEISDLYSELSRYIHSSYEELKPAIKGQSDWRFTFAFNRELFVKCEELVNRVMDVIYFTFLKRFDKPVELCKHALDTLKDYNCKMTLEVLKIKQSKEKSK